ncbi:MAG: dienelactone hydrolase family protein [Acidobacteriaceae bacterium]
MDKEREDERRESGKPGGGAGRKDEVGKSGVYPASGPYPEDDAEWRGQASWGQGERGAAGYEDHGGSELSYSEGQLLGGGDTAGMPTRVEILVEDAKLEGELRVPREVRGIVLFAHGSGSSRHSPRNQYVARVLQDAGIATLLFDLLTPEEDALDKRTAELRFNIALLANRLKQATEWLGESPKIANVKVGYFGGSTGAAAALVAAAEPVREISAVVSRGGRPDLAGSALPKVKAPTLLIVGGVDAQVLQLNRGALARLTCEEKLEVVPGATHLFEEEGALEEVARLASRWFEQRMGGKSKRVRAA